MTHRLHLICHASTSALRSAAFPDDEGIDEHGARAAAERVGLISRLDACQTGPERRCGQTAAALGLHAVVEPALADLDHGRWRGRSLSDVPADELARWVSDPTANPHGGETLVSLVNRVARWLAGERSRREAAITHQSVVRAAVLIALNAPTSAFWRIDAPPLSVTELTGAPGRWSLRLPD